MTTPRFEEVEPRFPAFVARTFGDEGRAWLEALPALRESVAADWRLTLGAELTGGLLSFTCLARQADGTEVVLKLGPPWPRVADEITALVAWNGVGAPALVAADRARHALLLERISPGAHADPGEPGAVATLLRRLHVPPPSELPPLAEIVARRLARAESENRATPERLAWARDTAARLLDTAPPDALVHGDFDDRNILVCDRRGLCAIDPLPSRGDGAYDAAYWVHANRRPGRRARLDELVTASGLPRDRVRDWAGVIAVHG